MSNPRRTICVMAVVLCLASSPVVGGIEFNDGGVHNIDYETPHAVAVDWAAPGMFTTVNWLEGASTGIHLNAYEDSRVNICGGSIAWWSWIYDRSKVTMSSGSIGENLFAYDNSQVTMSGGSIGWDLRAYDSSQITVSGGSIGWDLQANDRSQVTMSGGSIGGLYIRHSSKVTVSGGSIGGQLRAEDYSQVTVSGGSIGGLNISDSSQVTMSGGSIGGYLSAYGNSQVTICGGSPGDLAVDSSAILTILGSDFAVDGTPFGYGELASIFGGNASDEPGRHLTGILSSSDLLDSTFQIGRDARIVLLPEPTTVLLLGLGGLALRGSPRQALIRKRRANKN